MADITLEQFDKEARTFLDDNAERKEEEKAFKWGEGSDKVALFDERSRESELEQLAAAQEWRATKFDAGFGWISGPSEYGGRELPNAYERRWNQLEGEYQVPNQGFFGIGLGMVAPTILAHAHRHRQEPLPEGALPRRHRGVPAVQRARCRLGPGQPADQGRARRRRVAHHRPEGLDVGRAVQRHRRDHLPDRPRPAQAQGPHRLRRRHEGAGRRGAPAAPDDRRGVVQRGVLQRGAGGRRPAPGRRQPGLDRGPHHAHERAGRDRRRRRRRQLQRHPHAGDRDGPALRPRHRPDRAATSWPASSST